MRIGVITFPGSLDDRDAQRAIRLAGADPVVLWHGDHDLQGVDAIVLPGGFSYGDYLRAGAIAAKAPIMAEVIDAAGKGMPVLGICNGFQMLAEARLVPGAHTRNAHQQFIRRDQKPASRPPRPPGPPGSPRSRRSRSRSRTPTVGSSPTPTRSSASRTTARSCSVTSA